LLGLVIQNKTAAESASDAKAVIQSARANS
jgi:hypothetical protein